jgi:putative DNA primase/helicase
MTEQLTSDDLAGLTHGSFDEAVEQRPSANRAAPAAPGAMSDLAYAERLIDQHGHDLRHVRGVGWLAWDQQRWQPDDDEAQRRAKATAKAALAEAVDTGDSKTIAAAAGRCAEPRIRASLTLAASDTRVAAKVDDLDAHPLELNVANGILDLTDATLRPHNRSDLHTRLAGAAYQPDARSKRLETFIAQTTAGDIEFAGYLQRCIGYGLTGLTTEEVLFFLQGGAATGKTTLIEASKAVLGDYARTAAFATFLASRNDGDGPTPGIARLVGARMAASSEVAGGQRFNVERLKSLTGGDTVVARHLRREPFEYRPQFKVWLAANERPAIPADDEGAWRRVRLLPFTNVVPEHQRDPALKHALIHDPDERAAFLTWAVEGCLAWQRDGLGTCAAVEQATAAYRAENDPLGEWLNARCDLDPAHTTPANALRGDYEAWCNVDGDEPITTVMFARALAARGLRRKRTSRGTDWRGIALQPSSSGSNGRYGRSNPKNPHVRAYEAQSEPPATPATPATHRPLNALTADTLDEAIA